MRVAQLVLDGHEDSPELEAALAEADEEALAELLALAEHPATRVRQTLARLLPFLDEDTPAPQTVRTAVRLTLDPDIAVRGWACFALAGWREVDDLEVRDALAARLDDIARQVRTEALLGLALRQDPRVLPRVRAALARPSGTVWRLEMLAAGALGAPALHPLVARHQDGWARWEDARDAALVLRLTDPAGIGDDLLTTLAASCRRRAAGHPGEEGDAEAWHTLAALLDIAPHRAPGIMAGLLARLTDSPQALAELRERTALAQHAAAEGGRRGS